MGTRYFLPAVKKAWCWQGAATVRHSVGRELERRAFPPHDAQHGDGAHDDHEVRHDVGDFYSGARACVCVFVYVCE